MKPNPVWPHAASAVFKVPTSAENHKGATTPNGLIFSSENDEPMDLAWDPNEARTRLARVSSDNLISMSQVTIHRDSKKPKKMQKSGN